MRVLVVDDEQEIRLLLGKLLSKMGHQTTTASTIDEGRKRINEYGPEIVILDLFLPDGNGLSLVPQLKSELPDTGIIINSA
jgi:two-component system NtrC family response regulator